MESTPLLAMLTNEGFLPNYAFPEAGVTLKSVLWRKTSVNGKNQRFYNRFAYENRMCQIAKK